MRLRNLSFQEWIEHAFGREVRFQQSPWYFDPHRDWWDPSPRQAIVHFTMLFENPQPLLEDFADSQVAQGLTYLLDTMACGDNGWFSSPTVPLVERVRCVNAIGSFFDKLFKPRCTAHLSHLSGAEAGPLNVVCYMWWDTFPSLALAEDISLPILHDATITTMERILHLDSIACQESALHGLGHWQREHEERISGIIDKFCESPSIDPQLLAYAKSARCGCVL
jgi:hypothetical protein